MNTHTRAAAAPAATAAAALLATGSGVGSSSTPITACGQTVTTNAVLTLNLICLGSSGVVISASGITIDLKELTLRGDRSAGHYGIDDNGYDQVTLKNDGIYASGDRAVKGNRAEANGFSGGTSDLVGRRLEATGYTTVPVGTNVARGSDNYDECIPASLC